MRKLLEQCQMTHGFTVNTNPIMETSIFIFVVLRQGFTE